jgi:hypothetical protein
MSDRVMEKVTKRRSASWMLVTVVLAALAGGATVAARPMLEQESADARVLVEEGQRAVAQGDRARGVLAIERARLLAPRASFVRTAIDAADIRDAEDTVPRTLRLLTSREWAAIAVGFGWISGLALALAIFTSGRHRSRFAGRTLVASVVGLALSLLGVIASSTSSPAVVTKLDVRALVAPYAEAAANGPLPAGTIVMPGAEHGSFVRVRGADGLEGWVSQSSLEPIAGPAAG